VRDEDDPLGRSTRYGHDEIPVRGPDPSLGYGLNFGLETMSCKTLPEKRKELLQQANVRFVDVRTALTLDGVVDALEDKGHPFVEIIRRPL
jgi:hypothetical protein